MYGFWVQVSTYHCKCTREISDHTLVFELGWLLRDGFCDIVRDVWQSVHAEGTPLERWQAKIRRPC